ncbi:Peptidyl-prolyl cis-trans isomerase pin4 [Coemansia sp. RSA 2703]|nr:Peptidyl-prolyl cis-trans isomerase pin4 [Coemansia sp. RSA 2703]KAJ2372112.1 Peptidyl-prolyl cis-trans isomerase pin4 [Coemansia sp. RSA 2607]KAJ2395775.1 Peptidyl-prolyl cis-trans isomerase pin4 [Coemansia sp. RSA 2603]
MSKAYEETLRKLERAHISETNTGATSPSLASTVSAASPVQSGDMLAKDVSVTASATNSSMSASATPTTAATAAGDAARTDNDSTLGKNRARRAVQSMYGAPPGYNATMSVGGGRDSLGRGRVTSGRQRNSIMVPDHLQAALYPQNNVPTTPVQAPMPRLTGAEYALMANMPDDAIPNAIVVKNINFVIKREDLLDTMADLMLPIPYAFNYHYDGGVFRGLAFGNFRTPEEAARVIVGLNGVSLLGRPLKVEYKKALPGIAPPPHPNTIAMMNSSVTGSQSIGEMPSGDSGFASAMSVGQQQQQPKYDQPIPRPRRNQNGEMSERPRSMMVMPSSMPVPDHQQRPQQQQLQSQNAGSVEDSSAMINLDDEETRLLYDVVSQFRHDKLLAELSFPSALSTKHRQLVMLIAERFGLNHETKSGDDGRYIRVYKGLETLLEGTEVRRRSVASPNPAGLGNIGNSGGHGTQRYSSAGRPRPSSMLYPDTMAMNGMASPPPSSQRMSAYQPSHQGYNQDPTRVRSYTHTQGAGAHFAQPQQQQQQQHAVAGGQQPFPRTNDAPGRVSGNYGGYPSRLYQDSVVVPTRQPRGPEMSQNFVARQSMHQQDERQAQRQAQLKVLQQNRQRRLSASGEDGVVSGSTAMSPKDGSSPSAFRIEKPASRAIPIVKPPSDTVDSTDTSTEAKPASASPVSSKSANGQQ